MSKIGSYILTFTFAHCFGKPGSRKIEPDYSVLVLNKPSVRTTEVHEQSTSRASGHGPMYSIVAVILPSASENPSIIEQERHSLP